MEETTTTWRHLTNHSHVNKPTFKNTNKIFRLSLSWMLKSQIQQTKRCFLIFFLITSQKTLILLGGWSNTQLRYRSKRDTKQNFPPGIIDHTKNRHTVRSFTRYISLDKISPYFINFILLNQTTLLFCFLRIPRKKLINIFRFFFFCILKTNYYSTTFIVAYLHFLKLLWFEIIAMQEPT